MTGRAELRDGPEPRAGCAGWKVGELLFMAATICLVQLSVCLCCRFSLPPSRYQHVFLYSHMGCLVKEIALPKNKLPRFLKCLFVVFNPEAHPRKVHSFTVQ